jgi:hypothetical protein
LPFGDGAFDIAFSSNVYSHIEESATRAEFVAEKPRVARSVVILDQAWRPSLTRESYEARQLLDGSSAACSSVT